MRKVYLAHPLVGDTTLAERVEWLAAKLAAVPRSDGIWNDGFRAGVLAHENRDESATVVLAQANGVRPPCEPFDPVATAQVDIGKTNAVDRLLAATLAFTGTRSIDEAINWLDAMADANKQIEGRGPPTLETEIARVLNGHSAENASNTPDFILAHFLLGCLDAWNRGVTRRERWYGRAKMSVPPPDNASKAEPGVAGPCVCGKGYDDDGDGDCPACGPKESA